MIDCKSTKNEIINIRITSELKQKFEKHAQKKGMDVSEYIRYLILRELEKE